ncbi:GDSL-type esterase/lipase family protein [Colwellia sp. MSW7]|uniref:GDSL-type esterase/lipase family protein n=1 Tax=Colwellia maritima TaxID=2912588 RepID=A0ABS9WYG2_9GAMM|nr:GDSL-type esterase/lipase family protein [Colwellia maritima]MCI2282236.1 GDSL-type esterase/lipase family protein [Colwellia maritima]
MKYFLSFYFFILHIVIFTCFVKYDVLHKISYKLDNTPQEWQQTQKVTHAFYLRTDKNLSRGKVIFIGDSHVQGLAVNEVTRHGINFGIGRDTSKIVLKRIKEYQSIQSAKAIVFSFGINDLQYRTSKEIIENYKKIFDSTPKDTIKIVCAVFNIDTGTALLSVNNNDIRLLNNKLAKFSSNYENTTFLNINSTLNHNYELLSQYHIGDGIHLNTGGYQVWIDALKETLTRRVE